MFSDYTFLGTISSHKLGCPILPSRRHDGRFVIDVENQIRAIIFPIFVGFEDFDLGDEFIGELTLMLQEEIGGAETIGRP